MSITLRPATLDDQGFLFQVYAGTRQEEMALVPWDSSQKQAFLQMQFDAQLRHYHEYFSQAEQQVILNKGQPVGRLYLNRTDQEIRILDLSLLPEHRGGGIGTAILRSLLTQAQAEGKPVRIYLESFNPALRLYGRLGFSMIGEHGIHHLLEWRPAIDAGNSEGV